MQAKPNALVYQACRLIRPEEDLMGIRWMLYEIASHAQLCQKALEDAGLPVPGIEERSSYRKIVDDSGRLVRCPGEEPDVVPQGLILPDEDQGPITDA